MELGVLFERGVWGNAGRILYKGMKYILRVGFIERKGGSFRGFLVVLVVWLKYELLN